MAIVLGPVLGFRGETEGNWQVGALVVAEGGAPPSFQWRGGSPAPVKLAEHKGRTVWRFDMEVVRGARETPVSYEVNGEAFAFNVPQAGRAPRIAYTSCNGFSSLKLLKTVADKNALWKVMVAILSLDMRSERTVDEVLSPDHWEAVFSWLSRLTGPARCRHLLVMSSIPVVHPDFGLMESCLGALPGSQEIEDDLRDHWCSRRHRIERLRLIHRLLSFAENEGCRVTIVSGDVHVGALGVLQSTRSPKDGNALVINQLTSSGIVHPAPPGIMLFALGQLFRKTEEVDRGITAEMLAFPGTRRCFLGARNWLSLGPDEPPHPDCGRLWAQWTVEGEEEPYSKVIHPVE